LEIGVVIFCYNRPVHLDRLLASINVSLADRVYIIQDGLSKQSDIKGFTEVSDIIRNFSRIHVNITSIRRENNFGLRDNILSGLDTVTKQVNKVLVLEDDLEFDMDGFANCIHFIRTTPMTKKHYQMANRQHDTKYPNHVSCWGWAITSVDWPGSAEICENYKSANFKKIFTFFKVNRTVSRQIFLNLIKKRKTWAIFWWFYVYNKNFEIDYLPAKITNTGLDGSGVHCNPVRSQLPVQMKKILLNSMWAIFAVYSALYRRRLQRGWLTTIDPLVLPSPRINLRSHRIGSHGDGGYDIPEHFEFKSVTNVISLGLHDNLEFEHNISSLCDKANIQMFDGILNALFVVKRSLVNLLRWRWNRLLTLIWACSRRDKSRVKLVKKYVVGTVKQKKEINWREIKLEGCNNGLNILKMDIEGQEEEILAPLNKEHQFDLILLELHNVHQLILKNKIDQILDWENYYIYYVNVNNFSKINSDIPEVIELGLIKKDMICKETVKFFSGGCASSMNDPIGPRIVELSK